MKRGVPDILRRGVDNAIANWPLLLLRLAESVVFMVIIIVAVFLAVVPIIVSVGVHLADLKSPENFESLFGALASRWTIVFYLAGLVLVLLTAFSMVHAFLEAGCARVYVDGDRAAGSEPRGPASRYRVFSMGKWWAGAVDGWWPVLWMYVIAWTTALTFILVPAVITLALALLLRENAGLVAGVSCLGLLLIFVMLIPIGIGTAIWTNRAIASWAVRGGGARDTLAVAWAAFKADFGRHLLVALVMIVISFAGSMFIGSFTFFAGFAEVLGRHSDSITIMMLPVRFAGQFLSMAFGAIVAGWFLASFCAMANESPDDRVAEPPR